MTDVIRTSDDRTCKCVEMEEVPQSILSDTICHEFTDNDQGDCIDCNHKEACHEYPK